MKKIAIIIVLFAIVFGGLGGLAATDEQLDHDLDSLKAALASTQATSTGAELHAWALVAPESYTLRESEAAVKTMAQQFGMSSYEYNVCLRSSGYYNFAVVEYPLSEQVWLRLQVQSLDGETVATVELRQKHQRQLKYRWQQIVNSMTALGIQQQDVKITSCLEGYLSARLNNGEKLNKVYAAFNAVSATYREGIETNGVAVWTGWSPDFTQTVEHRHNDINFGIALGADDAKGGTWIRLGTPVLPGSY